MRKTGVNWVHPINAKRMMGVFYNLFGEFFLDEKKFLQFFLNVTSII